MVYIYYRICPLHPPTVSYLHGCFRCFVSLFYNDLILSSREIIIIIIIIIYSNTFCFIYSFNFPSPPPALNFATFFSRPGFSLPFLSFIFFYLSLYLLFSSSYKLSTLSYLHGCFRCFGYLFCYELKIILREIIRVIIVIYYSITLFHLYTLSSALCIRPPYLTFTVLCFLLLIRVENNSKRDYYNYYYLLFIQLLCYLSTLFNLLSTPRRLRLL